MKEPRRCPDHLFGAIEHGDEAEKYQARSEVMAWLTAQPRRHGDQFVVPDPETGAPRLITWEPKH